MDDAINSRDSAACHSHDEYRHLPDLCTISVISAKLGEDNDGACHPGHHKSTVKYHFLPSRETAFFQKFGWWLNMC